MPARTDTQCRFNDPEKRPLDQLAFPCEVGDGVKRKIPALDKHWAPRCVFAQYTGLVLTGACVKKGVDLEQWKYEAQAFKEDMEFLLACRHHEFWSYMVYQKAALAAVVSFLQHATPFYLDLRAKISDASIMDLYKSILRLVIRVICRLLTNKESPEAWLTKQHLRDLIYKNFLISVPMLFDLVVAVGDADPHNASVLRRIFHTLLTIEPKYTEDLTAALAFFRAAFRSIKTQAENEGFEGAGGGVAEEENETPYDDVALYALDCSYSLAVMLEVCPEVRVLCANIGLAQSIAQFYDSTIPLLYKYIWLINDSAQSLSWLNQARLQYLRAFRSIAYSYVDRVLQAPKDSLASSESFVALMTECLSEQAFVSDYQSLHPVELDVDILKQARPDLDEFKANFISEGYRRAVEAETLKTIDNLKTDISTLKAEGYTSPSNEFLTNGRQSSEESFSPPATTKRKRDLDEEVASVLDVFPDLGTGYIRRLLARYDSSEETITAILENNLPPDLAEVDRSEVYIPPDPEEAKITTERHNLFSGDKYDVMTQEKPQCIIKKGKGMPSAAKNVADLLDDKKDLEPIRHRYQEYTLVSEGSDSENGEYHDEYDDSYDALLESETRKVKSKDLKAVLADIEDDSDDDESEEQDDGPQGENSQEQQGQSEQGNHGNRMDFCENPEIIRARYEAKRQAKYGARQAKQQAPPERDVIGAPKGQGQDKSTLRNRQKKEANKSSRANHNRKAGAAYKRSKGMIS